jgi:hypothetical protein
MTKYKMFELCRTWGGGDDELTIIFKNGKPPLSLKAPRKNVESVRSIILPRLHVR